MTSAAGGITPTCPDKVIEKPVDVGIFEAILMSLSDSPVWIRRRPRAHIR
jgi:hypothetical protein